MRGAHPSRKNVRLHVDQRIDLDYETVWEGNRGYVEITNAQLV